MSELQLIQLYMRCVIADFVGRVRADDRGAVTAEQIVMIGAAVIGAGIVGAIIWQKMQDGANSIPTPAP